MPKLSDTMEEGKILRWLKKPGDRVAIGEVLAEVETDKADMELESEAAGRAREDPRRGRRIGGGRPSNRANRR